MKIKIFFLLLTFINFTFTNLLFAGAPALNKDPIPPAPYSLIKTNHLIIGVEWDKESIKEYLPLEIEDKNIITGGINIFNSKKKQAFSPLSGGYAWMDITKDGKNEKLILFSIYGLNKTINNVMKSVFKLDSEIGSNKVTLINNNATANTSIRKKNVLSLSAINSNNCTKAEGSDLLITELTAEKKIYQKIDWKTENQCDIEPVKVEFKGQYKKFVVKKLIWAKTQTNSKLVVQESITK